LEQGSGGLQNSTYIGGLRSETLYTLAVCHENSINLEPSLDHNGCWTAAEKVSSVKRNDAGLHAVSI
jgi:hypothetical protein